MEEKRLYLDFDNRTIKHLGIALYSNLPPVIAELVANAYDANASKVSIYISDFPEKEITIEDNGDGMSWDDLSIKYLEVGRDRREDATRINGRRPIGRKGIGKLSGFGISKRIKISTVKDTTLNEIILDYDQILKTKNGKYPPIVVHQNENTTGKNGTTVTLLNLKRKTDFSENYLFTVANDLSRRFSLFDSGFKVSLIYNNNRSSIINVTNELKFKALDTQFTWDIPLTNFEDDYEFSSQVKGQIISTNGPAPKNMKGVYLMSRGKMVNVAQFYGSDNQDFAFTHLTGWLAVDFIEDIGEDVISTNRESLNWETDETLELKEYLCRVLTKVKNEWRSKRKENKQKLIKESSGIDIETWITSLRLAEDRKIARKIVNSILSSSSISAEKAAVIIGYVQGTFEFEAFKYYADSMAEMDNISDDQLITLIQEWKLVESREIYNLSKVRVNAIRNLEKHMKLNSLEVSIMQKFFVEFPWILDPRIMTFKNEISYSQMLKDNFPDKNVKYDSNKRLDFLCINHIGVFFIIELKRPKSVIGIKAIQQGLTYAAFIKQHMSTEFNQQVVCIVLGGKLSSKPEVISLSDSLSNDGKVYFNSYSQLLSQAMRYHEEIIETFDKATEINAA